MHASTDHRERCLDGSEAERLAAGLDIPEPRREHARSCAHCHRAVEEIRACNRFLAQNARPIRKAMRDAQPFLPLVPGYQVLAGAEAGGQGIVYKAVQLATRRPVALKLLRDGALATDLQRFRFERETELLATLRHPNIVAVFDKGRTADGRDFLVMEWVEGTPLNVFVRSSENIKPSPRPHLQLFLKIARAIEHAHGGSIIHRDLKPSNILVDAAGEPHIIDFGLARPDLPGRGLMTTRTNDFAGTRAYASPEQVAGLTDQLRVTTDVYSLGVILFEMLTGTFPYPIDGSPSEVDRHIQLTEPVIPRDHLRSLPGDVRAIMLTALRKKPDERYRSAGALAADVEDSLAGRPIAAKKDRAWYVIRHALRRHRRTLVGIGAAALALTVGGALLVTYEILDSRASAQRVRAVTESERADGLSLLLQSTGNARLDGASDDLGYPFRGYSRLREQIKLGWLGDKPGLQGTATSLIADGFSRSAPQETEELLRQALVNDRRMAPRDERRIARDLRELAAVLIVRRRYSEAQDCARESLDVIQRLDGPGIEAADAMELLASAASSLGDAAGARKFSTDATDITITQLGGENLLLARCLNTRGQAELMSGDTALATSDAVRALKMRLSLLPDEAPEVRESLRQVAAVMRAPGHAEGTLIGWMPESGDGDRARALDRIADAIQSLVDPRAHAETSAVPLIEEVAALKTALLGPLHRSLLSSLAAIVVELVRQNDAQGQVEALARVAAVLRSNDGPRSLALTNCLEQRTLALATAGRFAEAATDLREAVDMWWDLPAGVRDDFQAAINERYLGYYLILAGEDAEADRRLRHCSDVIARTVGAGHYSGILARSYLAWVALQTGRLDEALLDARSAASDAEKAREIMPTDQRLAALTILGLVQAARHDHASAEATLLAAWNGDGSTMGMKELDPQGPLRRLLIEAMVDLCHARGDTEAETAWKRYVGNQPQR